MGRLLEQLGVERPVVQAGMGSISRHELAAAVSEAGGLGTIAVIGARAIAAEVAAARRLTDKPIAVNVLLPYARRDWWPEAAMADVVVTFWGRPRRRVARTWLHQCGSVEEAQAARGAGADGVIVQGVEAGGHVRGALPALELLERVRTAVGDEYPVLVAGGIAGRDDVRAALEAGADAGVAGTRFLLSTESHAHGGYRERVLQADRTILTTLFGMGWPAAQHRVVPNAATDRWLRDDVPAGVRALHRLSGVGARYLPGSLQARMVASQRADRPLLTPQPPTDDGVGGTVLVDCGALYAGETALRIADVRPAAELVGELSPS